MKANGKASPWYGKVMTASLPSEVKKIWFSRDEELPDLPCHRWSWQYETDVEEADRRELAVKILDSFALSDRYLLVLQRRIFEDATLDDIAEELGVTKERVRQMELKILRHLRTVQSRFTGINPWDLTLAEVTTWRGWRWSR